MKNGLKLTPVLTVMAFLLGLPAHAAPKATITMWVPWGGTLGKNVQDIADAYSKKKGNITVKILSVPNNLETNEKFMASMVAGTPPEIIMVDGPQVINWAARGLLTPLDKFYSSSRVRPSDFWTPSWNQTLWNGHSYAVPMLSDPNFPMIYNKKAFAEAGLGQAPATLAQLESFTEKLNKKDANGRYSMLGFMPWWHCGMSNMLFTFGWMFGGDFYDAGKGKVTCNDPKVVKALDWFDRFARLYNIRELDRMTANFGGNPIVGGKVAMMPHTSDFLIEARARKFQYGWGHMPVVPGGPEKSVWIGGWTAGIPANAKRQKEAWEFLKWLCVDAEGTKIAFKQAGFTMSAKNSPIYKDYDESLTPWMKSFDRAEFVRPVTPVTPVYFKYLDIAVDSVIHGKQSAPDALEAANKAIQKELDRFMSTKRK